MSLLFWFSCCIRYLDFSACAKLTAQLLYAEKDEEMRIDWPLIRFPFDDPRWQSKALIGGLLALAAIFLPLPFIFLMLPLSGYGIRTMRHTITGEPPSLPEWDDWGELFTDGLKVWVVGFVYELPLIILICCSFGAHFAAFPLMALAADKEAFGLAVVSGLAGYAILFGAMSLMTLIALPLGFLIEVAITRMAATGSLNSAFELGAVWRLARQGFKNYLIAYLVYMAVMMVIGMIASAATYTIILCCLYPFIMGFAAFYGQAFRGALFGMAYYHSQAGPRDAPPAIEPREEGKNARGTPTSPTL